MQDNLRRDLRRAKITCEALQALLMTFRGTGNTTSLMRGNQYVLVPTKQAQHECKRMNLSGEPITIDGVIKYCMQGIRPEKPLVIDNYTVMSLLTEELSILVNVDKLDSDYKLQLANKDSEYRSLRKQLESLAKKYRERKQRIVELEKNIDDKQIEAGYNQLKAELDATVSAYNNVLQGNKTNYVANLSRNSIEMHNALLKARRQLSKPQSLWQRICNVFRPHTEYYAVSRDIQFVIDVLNGSAK